MSIINGRPLGSDITLLNTIYLRPRKNDDTGKWDNGSMTLVYRDNKTGLKHNETMDNPKYEFFMAKNGHKAPHNRMFIAEEDAERIEVPYIHLEKNIAELTGNMEFFKQNIADGNRFANRQLHRHPDIFNSDMHIEDHYRFRFAKEFTNDPGNISKSYFDIEANTEHMKGDFPEPGECPINAITIILEKQNKVYTLLLRDKTNPLIEEFEKTLSDDFVVELKNVIRESVGGWKNEVRFGLQDFEYKFLFYDEEEEIRLIQDLFIIINNFQPDFVLAWNMGFDIPYIIQRIINLGYRPEDIMCHPDFKYPVVRYFIDERNKNEYAERGDFATIASYSVFTDQMIHFASRRKGQSAFTAFGLDYIGNTVAGVRKYNYSGVSSNLQDLPKKNYKAFVIYNIIDTIVQKCIEVKTGDIDYVYNKCNMNNTRYAKCHRQTVYLVNRGGKEFLGSDNFIIGNNINKDNEKPKKFQGAFVADPTKMDDYAKIKINGHAINVLNNNVDFDYASLYPSLLREFNMAPNTQIGMIIIPSMIWDGENRRHERDDYSRSGEFLENLQSRSYLEFCHRWFQLGDYMEVCHDINEFFILYQNPVFGLRMTTLEGLIIPAFVMNKDLPINPAEIMDINNPRLIRPAEIVISPNRDKIKEVIDNANTNPKHRYIYNDGSSIPIETGNILNYSIR